MPVDPKIIAEKAKYIEKIKQRFLKELEHFKKEQDGILNEFRKALEERKIEEIKKSIKS